MISQVIVQTKSRNKKGIDVAFSAPLNARLRPSCYHKRQKQRHNRKMVFLTLTHCGPCVRDPLVADCFSGCATGILDAGRTTTQLWESYRKHRSLGVADASIERNVVWMPSQCIHHFAKHPSLLPSKSKSVVSNHKYSNCQVFKHIDGSCCAAPT